MEPEWDKFQTQVQQMQEVWLPLLARLMSNMLLNIIDILAWGSSHKAHGHGFLGLN